MSSSLPAIYHQEKAAEMVNVNPRYVQIMKNIRKEDPELHAQVKAGEVDIKQAKWS